VVVLGLKRRDVGQICLEVAVLHSSKFIINPIYVLGRPGMGLQSLSAYGF